MKNNIWAKFLTGALVASSITWMPTAAQATSTGIDYYISAPFVQNSHIDLDAPTTYFETFESLGLAGLVTTASGTVTWSSSAQSQIFNSDAYGGSISTSSSPIVGTVAGSKYLRPTGGDITINFATDQKYLGFWWSAGSGGNVMKFRNNGQEVLSLTTADLFSLFGTPPTSGAANDTSDVIAFTDGTTTINHPKDYYFGHPKGYTSITPTNNSGVQAQNEPFTYVHVFANGTFAFDEIVMLQGGFEIDNLVASSVPQTPDLLRHYKVSSIYPVVTFLPNSGNGYFPSQISSASASLSQNLYTKTGYAFAGWNTAQDGSGTTYSDRATYDFQANLTLYAQWVPNSVIFDANGGTGTMSQQVGTASASLSPNLFTRSGFTFQGWNTAADGSGTAYSNQSSFGFTQSRTLFAQWQAISSQAPEPSRYNGPTVELRKLLPISTQLEKILVKGTKLDLITSVTIDGVSLKVTSQTPTELTFEYTPRTLGVFDVTFLSEFGKLTVLEGIRVYQQPQVNEQTDSGSSNGEEDAFDTFTATKRFFNFIGDRGALVTKDRKAIRSWISEYAGIEEVICLGSTSGVPMISTDPALARKRAVNACKAISDQLPGVRVTIRIENGKGVGQYFRAVQVTIKGTSN